MTAIQDLTTGIRVTRDRQDILAADLTRAKVEGAVRTTHHMVDDGRGGVKTVVTRSNPTFERAVLRQYSATVNGFEIRKRYDAAINRAFGEVQSDLNFSKRLNDAFVQMQTLATGGAADPYQVVNKVRQMTDVVHDTASQLFESASQVETEMSGTIESVNQLLRQIHENNVELGNATTGDVKRSLQGIRDALLNKLSYHIDVDVSYGSNGAALVRSLGHAVVNERSYAQLSYSSRSHTDLTSGVAPSEVSIMFVGGSGGVQTIDSSTMNLSKGALGGLVQVRDVALPEAIDSVNAIAATIVENVNAMHNKFASIGNATLKGSTAIAENDFVEVSGKVRIAVVNADGTAVEGAPGGEPHMRSVDVDLGELQSIYGQGKVQVKDLMAALVDPFRHDGATPTVAMGAIADPTGAPGATYPGQFLLNDARLVGRDNIAANGDLTFDLEFDNSSVFGCEVETLSVEVWNAGAKVSDGANLAEDVIVAAGSSERAGASVKVNIPGAGAHEIRVKLRILGDNGQVEEGTVVYTVDRNVRDLSALMNKRLKGVPDAAAPGAMAPRPDAMPTLLQAAMLDNIDHVVTDPSEKGFVALRAASDQYNVIVQDLEDSKITVNGVTRGCGHFFGFNNLMQVGDVNPALSMNVVDRILANVNLLASNKLISHNSTTKQYILGETSASALMRFNFAGGNPVAGDTITVAGETLTFAAGVPANQNEIEIGATAQDNIDNIRNAINAHRNLSSLLTVEADVVNTLKITARRKGEAGNDIQVACNFTIGGGVARAAIAGDAATLAAAPDIGVPATLLDGGTNTAAEDRTDPDVALSFAPGNAFVSGMAGFGGMHIVFDGSAYVRSSESTTLRAVVARTHQTAVSHLAAADRNVKVSKETLDSAAKEFVDAHGIDANEIYAAITLTLQYYNALSISLMKILAAGDKLYDRLASA